jgi:hypothetical protein
MDLGSILQVILSSGAALAVARGIFKAEVQVEDKARGLSVRAKNVTVRRLKPLFRRSPKF